MAAVLGMLSDGGEQNAVATFGTAISADPATLYSNVFSPYQGTNFALHWETYSSGSDLVATVTLWTSDKRNPSLADDSDWVDSGVTITGPDHATASSTAQKGSLAVGNGGHRHYRVKFVRSAGSGLVGVWVSTRSQR